MSNTCRLISRMDRVKYRMVCGCLAANRPEPESGFRTRFNRTLGHVLWSLFLCLLDTISLCLEMVRLNNTLLWTFGVIRILLNFVCALNGYADVFDLLLEEADVFLKAMREDGHTELQARLVGWSICGIPSIYLAAELGLKIELFPGLQFWTAGWFVIHSGYFLFRFIRSIKCSACRKVGGTRRYSSSQDASVNPTKRGSVLSVMVH